MDFYPDQAAVPEKKRTERLWLRQLRATDAERDYEAVMASKEQLRGWSGGRWPKTSQACSSMSVSTPRMRLLPSPSSIRPARAALVVCISCLFHRWLSCVALARPMPAMSGFGSAARS